MKLNKTTESVSISLPTWLLELIDLYCEENDLTRANLVKKALKNYLACKNSEQMPFWQAEYDRIYKNRDDE